MNDNAIELLVNNTTLSEWQAFITGEIHGLKEWDRDKAALVFAQLGCMLEVLYDARCYRKNFEAMQAMLLVKFELYKESE